VPSNELAKTISGVELTAFLQQHDEERLKYVSIWMNQPTEKLVELLTGRYGTAPTPMTDVDRLQVQICASEQQREAEQATAQEQLRVAEQRSSELEGACAKAKMEHSETAEKLATLSNQHQKLCTRNAKLERFLCDHGFDAATLTEHAEGAQQQDLDQADMDLALQQCNETQETLHSQLEEASAVIAALTQALLEA
jgi:predicted RNase H-like nuclease (RuvC/YqgF family)